VLLGVEDDSIFLRTEQGELERPIARKVLSDRTIYISRSLPMSGAPPVICDLGEARVGAHKHKGDIMPGIYRAPEVILYVPLVYNIEGPQQESAPEARYGSHSASRDDAQRWS
jgi:hypothetical protein